jgi:hypothetical protein
MKIKNLIAIGISVAFFLLYVYYCESVLINFPVLDDYGAIVKFNLDYLELNTLKEKINIIFSQGNDHRLAFLKVINLAYVNIFGQVNFRHFKFIGMLFYFLTIVFIFLVGEFKISKFIYFVPVPMLMLSFSFSEIFFLAMESLTHLPVILFSTITAYLIVKAKKVILPILFLFLAIYSNGNGILLIPLGILGYFIMKEYRKLAYWVFFSSMFLLFYFYNFNIGNQTYNSDIVMYTLKVFPIFIGGIGSNNSTTINFLFGILAIASSIYFLIYKKNYKAQVHLSILLAFYFMTFLLITIKRNNFGYSHLFRGAYMINSIMIFTILYVLFYKTIITQWLLNHKYNRINFSLLVIFSVLTIYQYRNFTSGINTLNWFQNNTKSLMVMTYGKTKDFYKNENEFNNSPLVMSRDLYVLAKKGLFNIPNSLKNVLAKKTEISDFEITKSSENQIILNQIDGSNIAENPYLTLSCTVNKIVNANQVGVIIENSKQKQLFLIPITYQKNALNRNNHSLKFQFLLEKNKIIVHSFNLKFCKVKNNKIEIENKNNYIKMNNLFFNNKLITKPVLINKEFTTNTISAYKSQIDAFYTKDSVHIFTLNLKIKKSDEIPTEKYLCFKNTKTLEVFMVKFNVKNTSDNSQELVAAFKQKDVEELLKDRQNTYTLSLFYNYKNQINKNIDLGSIYYLNSEEKH